MGNRSEKQYGDLIVVQRQDYTWGIINKDGVEVVPFGKYDWIDGFDSGLARVKVFPDKNKNKYGLIDFTGEEKWGIIDVTGKEVLSPIYDAIWNFYGKNRYSTKVIREGISKDVYFCDLNPNLPDERPYRVNRSYYRSRYGCSYGEYEGTYAQDVMGYSDEAINDAFEGDPEAYWNID